MKEFSGQCVCVIFQKPCYHLHLSYHSVNVRPESLGSSYAAHFLDASECSQTKDQPKTFSGVDRFGTAVAQFVACSQLADSRDACGRPPSIWNLQEPSCMRMLYFAACSLRRAESAACAHELQRRLHVLTTESQF